jgi:hypothetical protein
MRIVVAKRHGRRGAGLGNEILPWAKGWIASQVLEAYLVGPSWGINPRRYHRNFRTSRLDFLLEDALQCLPHYAFTEQDYHDCEEIDFGAALRKWARAKGIARKRSYIVSVDGMWGGYPSIRCARAFLLARLLNSRNVFRHFYQITSRLSSGKLFVAVHMRSGGDGFIAPAVGEDIRGKFNILVPENWYLWVCGALQERYRDAIQFHFFTDRRSAEFEEAVRRFNPGQVIQEGLTECSDLCLMAHADLRVCSVSSYSLAASFLSEGPYLWYEPQLSLSHGHYSLWGDCDSPGSVATYASRSHGQAPDSHARSSATQEAPALALGTAMNIGDPLPEDLVRLLDQRLSTRKRCANLLEYGSIPQSVGPQNVDQVEAFQFR